MAIARPYAVKLVLAELIVVHSPMRRVLVSDATADFVMKTTWPVANCKFDTKSLLRLLLCKRLPPLSLFLVIISQSLFSFLIFSVMPMETTATLNQTSVN